MEANDEKRNKKIEQLIGEVDSNHLVRRACKELIPNRKAAIWLVVIILISALVAYFIASSDSTIIIFEKISNIFNALMISIFGIIFTVFAIFQALLNDDYLAALDDETIKVKDKDGNEIDTDETYLSRNVTYLERIIVCYFIGVLLDVIVLIIITFMGEGAGALILAAISDTAKMVISFACVTIYLAFNLWLIVELKSVVFNLSKLFRIYIMSKVKSRTNNNDKDN